MVHTSDGLMCTTYQLQTIRLVHPPWSLEKHELQEKWSDVNVHRDIRPSGPYIFSAPSSLCWPSLLKWSDVCNSRHIEPSGPCFFSGLHSSSQYLAKKFAPCNSRSFEPSDQLTRQLIFSVWFGFFAGLLRLFFHGAVGSGGWVSPLKTHGALRPARGGFPSTPIR